MNKDFQISFSLSPSSTVFPNLMNNIIQSLPGRQPAQCCRCLCQSGSADNSDNVDGPLLVSAIGPVISPISLRPGVPAGTMLSLREVHWRGGRDSHDRGWGRSGLNYVGSASSSGYTSSGSFSPTVLTVQDSQGDNHGDSD